MFCAHLTVYVDDLTEMIIAAIENERKATEPIPTPVPGPAVTVEPPQAHPKPEIERRGGFSMSMGDLGRLPVGTPSKPGPIHSHPMYSNGHPMGPPNGMTEMSPMGMPGPMHGGMGNGMPMHMPPRHTGPYGGPIHNGNMHGMHRDMAHGMHGGHMPGGAPMHGGMMMHGGMSHERERWRQDEFAKMEGDRADGASSSSLSPSGERKKLSRKEFRETIGVQLYADLMSGEYSYDEVIAKYKKLYPEYESKFTRNFCSKTRCGRIMTASTSEPKRNVKAGDPKIQRISKKSPRKPWTRMTRELVWWRIAC